MRVPAETARVPPEPSHPQNSAQAPQTEMKPNPPLARSKGMRTLPAVMALLAAIAFVLSPVVSPGFNGFSPDQFPVPQVDPPIQPVGWAFSIWGVIYLWLVVSTVFGVLKRGDDPGWAAARPPLIASLVLGAAWIPLAQISPLWATVLIWLMLATAVIALVRTPDFDPLWFRAPVGLYAGWLTAASCVATAILLTGYGATPVLPIHAAFVLLALAIATMVMRRVVAPTYALGVIWALMGIIVANLDPTRPVMVAIAGIGIALLVIPLGVRYLTRPTAPQV